MNSSWKSSLQDEITKRKQLLEKAKATQSTPSQGTSLDTHHQSKHSKYVKRSDLERVQREEYYREQQRLEEARRQKKRKQDASLISKVSPDVPTEPQEDQLGHSGEESSKVRNLAEVAEAVKNALETKDTLDIAPEEAIRRLRSRGQPIRLFGETDRQRAIRLRALELIDEKSEGQRNDFMKTLEETESGLALEALQKQAVGDTAERGGSSHTKKRRKELFMKEYDTTQLSRELLKENADLAYTLVYVYLKRLLYEWEDVLNNRPDKIRTSAQGKLAAATQRQTSDYLRPLFKLLKQNAVAVDVMEKLVDIVQLTQLREYSEANSVYLQLSIGNSPWPIGVTMVGIHERSAREKIFSNQVAHVLNDETQRKWIQSVKRLMTFAQNQYPPDDLAKAMG
ncbi:hypothetical protein IWQ61_008578 [Dispira simplex]|nr:hypothetical protein IWQ61_008578 [Dispira simplex]